MMAWFSFNLFCSFLLINIIIIQRSSCDSTSMQEKENPDELFSFFDHIRRWTGQNQKISEYISASTSFRSIPVDDLRCPEKWSRFLNLCYFLSNYMSTIAQANQTCHIFHLNHSRLMYIKEPLELFYAAHVLAKSNLNNLLLEIDPDLIKGKQ
jgi:hypothetical protein